MWLSIAPAIKATWHNAKESGGVSTIALVIVVAGAVWVVARQQNDDGPGPGGGGDTSPGGGSTPHGYSFPNGYANGAASGAGPPPQPQQPPPRGGYTNGSAGATGAERPKPTWQRTNPASGASFGANANTTAGGAAKGAWEKAREETKRKEEERKAKEAEQKRKEDMEKRLKEAREKEARERAEREKKLREQREGDQKERETREKAGSSYAYSAMGEKTNPWPQGRPPAPRSQPNSPTKRPPAPTARTYRGTDDEEYSYRPYDTPKKPAHKKAPSIYSESSYAPSQSTSRTTPPPSHRGPYHTKDPDKIVIKAVYSFNNSFLRTPTSQLISGVGSVTDGLILRITTEGLFIDDDVRGVPQREWDVKAWTMKLVEVWCPSFRHHLDASASARVASASTSAARISMRRLWGLDSSSSQSKEKAAASSEELDVFLTSFLQICRDSCHSSASASDTSSIYSASSQSRPSVYTDYTSTSTSASASPLSSKDSNIKTKRSPTDKTTPRFQTGENKAAGLHVLRASIRDQDGKRYVFIISEDESWKVAVGLQRLRKGTQVRALGLSGMTVGDARGTLESLGWI